jgi:hypothetical protein
MEKISRISTHDVAGRPDSMGNRVYFEREIRSYDGLSKNERYFMAIIQRISGIEDPQKRDLDIRKIGKLLGDKIVMEIRGGYDNGRFDAKGIPRGGSYLQQFIIKAALLGKKVGVLTHPSFIEEFEKASGNFLKSMYGIEAVLRGVKSVVDYYRTLSNDTDITFMGFNIYLDTRHNVDMLIARTGEDSNQIDQVDLCEVKSSRLNKNQIQDVHDRHSNFIRASKEVILNGLGTSEGSRYIEKIKDIDDEGFMQIVEDRMSFLADFVLVDKSFPDINSWDDIKMRADQMGVNPILLAIRLRNIVDTTVIHLKTEEKEKMFKLRDVVFKIPVPAEELGLYHRLIDPDNHHIGKALTWKSIVACKLPDDTWQKDEVIIKNI